MADENLGDLYRLIAQLQAQVAALGEENEGLRHHNDFLDLEVAKRTQDLAMHVGELDDVNKLLAESDRYKDQFLGVLSHELRTPLNFIMGFASVLGDRVLGPLNAQQAASVDKVLEGGERMLRLVDNLLDSSSIQAGRFSVSPVATSGQLVLDSLRAPMALLASQKGVALSVNGFFARPLMLDHERIVQVIFNLFSNALKFTPQGGLVALRMTTAPGTLVVEVQDTGIGIADEHLPLLFTRFKQLDGSSTRQAPGLGLGLAISRAIVEAHGGRIGVKSQLNVGSTFRFELPVVAPTRQFVATPADAKLG